MKFKSVDEQFAYLKKGAAEIIREDDLKSKLGDSLKTAKPLRVYLGVDPTAPDLHLGTPRAPKSSIFRIRATPPFSS